MHVQVEEKDEETWETRETKREKKVWRKKEEQLCKQSGCFSWMRITSFSLTSKLAKDKEAEKKIKGVHA